MGVYPSLFPREPTISWADQIAQLAGQSLSITAPSTNWINEGPTVTNDAPRAMTLTAIVALRH